MKIGVIGAGIVGSNLAHTYASAGHEILMFDIKPGLSDCSFQAVLETSEVVFLCLPTPDADNGMSVGAIEETLRSLRGVKRRKDQVLVLKSTVPVGTTRMMAEAHDVDLVHSPEFITERTALLDSHMPRANVIGVACHKQGWNTLHRLYQERFPYTPTHIMDSEESELAKLATNAFYATKVAFFNELKMLTTHMRLGWDVVLHAMLGQGMIHPAHTKVPGPDGKFGFGGKCLPKDLAEYVRTLEENVMHYVAESAIHSNRMFRKEDSK